MQRLQLLLLIIFASFSVFAQEPREKEVYVLGQYFDLNVPEDLTRRLADPKTRQIILNHSQKWKQDPQGHKVLFNDLQASGHIPSDVKFADLVFESAGGLIGFTPSRGGSLASEKWRLNFDISSGKVSEVTFVDGTRDNWIYWLYKDDDKAKAHNGDSCDPDSLSINNNLNGFMKEWANKK